MNTDMKTLRQLAKTVGIAPGKLSKTELIKKIQVAEGNFDCYGSAIEGECDQGECAWRADCLSESVTAAAPSQ